MTQPLFQKRIGRRTFLGATAAGAALAGGLAPSTAAAAAKTVKIGFLAPLTGEVAAWGLPGLYGCEIWAEKVNAAGGVRIGDDTCTFEFVSYDNEYAPEKARAGATKLIFEDEVKFIMMLAAIPGRRCSRSPTSRGCWCPPCCRATCRRTPRP